MARSSRKRRKARRRQAAKPPSVPAVQRATPSEPPVVEVPAFEERMTRWSERLRAYRWGVLFIPMGIAPLVASSNNMIAASAGTGAGDPVLLIAALVIYLLIAVSAVVTVRRARRRGHGWLGSLGRGALAAGCCLAAVLMGTALGLSAHDVAGGV